MSVNPCTSIGAVALLAHTLSILRLLSSLDPVDMSALSDVVRHSGYEIKSCKTLADHLYIIHEATSTYK